LALSEEINAIKYFANNLYDFVCGGALGVFFAHTASDKLFQL